ncbi:MAG: hypothetical protein ACMXX9_00220 [Candidatus Woesearchaeota archaeon]
MEKDYEEKDFETLALEEVAYGTQHTVAVLIELLIKKGVITEQEFKDMLDEMIARSEAISDEE